MTEQTPMNWDVAVARGLKASGLSLAQIATVFGVTPDTVHCRIDPDYRAHRQRLKNAGRGHLSDVITAAPKPSEDDRVWKLKSPIGRELGIKAITIREISSSHPVGKSARWQRVPVSLPYVAFLYGEAR